MCVRYVHVRFRMNQNVFFSFAPFFHQVNKDIDWIDMLHAYPWWSAVGAKCQLLKTWFSLRSPIGLALSYSLPFIIMHVCLAQRQRDNFS